MILVVLRFGCSLSNDLFLNFQAQPKEKKDMSGPRLNDQITAPVIRLVTEEGISIGWKCFGKIYCLCSCYNISQAF